MRKYLRDEEQLNTTISSSLAWLSFARLAYVGMLQAEAQQMQLDTCVVIVHSGLAPSQITKLLFGTGMV